MTYSKSFVESQKCENKAQKLVIGQAWVHGPGLKQLCYRCLADQLLSGSILRSSLTAVAEHMMRSASHPLGSVLLQA